jgi:CXXX repeat peptide maturase
MLTYFIIVLDDTSVSYCHFDVKQTERRLIPLDTLRRSIVWAMKENLNIQFVYPHYRLPEEYREVIETIDHTKIGPVECGEKLNVIVTDDLASSGEDKTYIWRCSLADLEHQQETVKTSLGKAKRLNVVLTDIAKWQQEEFDCYQHILDSLADHIVELYSQKKAPQMNLLTDRLILNEMNNCGAGDSSVTIAPDGRFYICPAFYPVEDIGSLDKGLSISNPQLLRLDHAPICRVCDAWQCRRCIWMNGQLTGDMNTPSHQQCVVAHIERNASRRLQQLLDKRGIRIEGWKEIRELDYLDPFSIATRWK